LNEYEYIQVFYRLYISVLLLEIQLSRGEDWDPIDKFNPAAFCMPVPNQNLDFQRHM